MPGSGDVSPSGTCSSRASPAAAALQTVTLEGRALFPVQRHFIFFSSAVHYLNVDFKYFPEKGVRVGPLKGTAAYLPLRFSGNSGKVYFLVLAAGRTRSSVSERELRVHGDVPSP